MSTEGFLAVATGGAGEPVSQVGGVNVGWNNDGTCATGLGSLPAPANWCSEAPSPGTGQRYYIKFTDNGLSSGTATTITNNNVVQPLGTATCQPGGGAGGRKVIMTIYADSSGSNQVAQDGTYVTRNDI